MSVFRFSCSRLPFLPFTKPPFLSPPIFSLSSSSFTRRRFTAMDSNTNTTNSVSVPESNSDVLHEFLFFNVFKDGRITVFAPPMKKVPPADDSVTGVKIKDVQISTDVSARMFLPPSAAATAAKFPVLLYVHGGGFCMQSAYSTEYTGFLTRLVAAGDIIAVSVEYGLFPARPIPACYDDSWEALRWIASHARGSTDLHDSWLSRHADMDRLFIAGDSAGGNICHTLAVRAGTGGLPGGVKVAGATLIHPYFGEDDKMWMYMCPSNEGPRDRRMKPDTEDLARIGCGRVLVMVGERDGLREAGTGYVEELIKSRWKGTVEIMENKEKDHCFHLSNPEDEEAVAIQNSIISFIYHK